MRRLAILTAALLLPLSACSGGSDKAGRSSWQLPALSGTGTVKLSDFKGKPLVVNFFASWCSACNEELPDFVTVSDALKGKVTFVGVDSLENGDKNLLVKKYALDKHFAALAEDLGGFNGDKLHKNLGGGDTMPLTAFYDAKGKLLDVEKVALYPNGTLATAVKTLYGFDV